MTKACIKQLRFCWYYWLLVGLFIAQAALAVNYHVLICNLSIANSLLLVIVLAHKGYEFSEKARELFNLMCALVAFAGVLFVNTSHALELLTQTGHEGHEHGHDSEHSEFHDHHHNGTFIHEEDDAHTHTNINVVPFSFVCLEVFDFLLKFSLQAAGVLPRLGLPLILRFALHTVTPIIVISLYSATEWLDLPDNWFFTHLDPLLTVVISISLFLTIIPAFLDVKPFIFVETPACFETDAFKKQLSEKFSDATCAHLHVYRAWPIGFEAMIHVTVQVDKTSKDWSSRAAVRFQTISNYVRETLTVGGATKVVLEPKFVCMYEEDQPWIGCVRRDCHANERGCCTKTI